MSRHVLDPATPAQAAAFLNVSIPFVIEEIKAQRLTCCLVNSHRRIEFEELLRYQKEQKKQSMKALKIMQSISDEIGEAL